MVKLKVEEQEYGLRMDLYAMELIEDEFGSLGGMFEALKAGKTKTVRDIFRILANAALSFQGKEETVTGKELLRVPVGRIEPIANAIKAAISEGMKSEATGGGEADDEIYDVYLDEIEKKEPTGAQPE